MKPRHLLFGLLAVGAMAAAGDQAVSPSGKSAPPVQEGPAPPKPTPTPAASPTPDPEKLLEEFVPSEKLPADRAVAFPVDI
jgi:hypothetical protein